MNLEYIADFLNPLIVVIAVKWLSVRFDSSVSHASEYSNCTNHPNLILVAKKLLDKCITCLLIS